MPEANKHIQVSAFDLNQARKGGKFIYLIEYDLIHDIERRNQTPWEVFKHLIKCGTILETVFDLDSAGTLDDEPSNRLMLEVLYATVLEPEMLEGLVDVPPERVKLIEKNGAIRPLAEPIPVPSGEALATSPSEPAIPSTPAPCFVPAAAPLAAAPLDPAIPLPPPPFFAPAAAPLAAAPAEPATSPTPAPGFAPASAPVENTPKAVVSAPAPASETTIRLNVTLLDSLMTLAGELVLSRNQLNESLSRQDERGIRSGAQRVSLVTSELQEVVTLTRMQPVGSLFAKFPRLVRDLARDLE